MPQSEIITDLQALVANYRYFSVQNPGQTIVPVIKNAAYGHGIASTALALAAAGVNILAVFNLEEAKILRDAGYTGRIWSLEGALLDEIELAAEVNATLACWNLEVAQALSDYAVKHNHTFQLHLKLDTGMSRLGFLPDQIPQVLPKLLALPGLQFSGCFSHLALADKPEHPITKKQVADFRAVAASLPPQFTELHLCATDGILNKLAPELPFARLGIGLYGYHPDPVPAPELRPVLKLRSVVASLKTVPAPRTVSYGATYALEQEEKLAVVPVGYADGFSRALSNTGLEVLVRGRRCPIRGRICMGMMMVDVSALPEISLGDEVVLLGSQGQDCITISELAARLGTITHELLCLLGNNPHHKFI